MARGRSAVNRRDGQPLLTLQRRALRQLRTHAPRQDVGHRPRAATRNPLRVRQRACQRQLVLAGTHVRVLARSHRRECVCGGRSRQALRQALQARLRLLHPSRLSVSASRGAGATATQPTLPRTQVSPRSAHVLRQEGHETRRLRRPENRARRQEGPAQGRVQRQRRQRAAESGGGPGLVDGTEGGQALARGLPRARGWSVEQGQFLHRGTPRGHLEARVRQVLRGDARRGLRGPARHVHRIHDAHGDAGAGTRGATRTLLEACERSRDRDERGEAATRVKAWLAREPRVHDDGHARDRQRGLRNRRGEDDAASGSGGECTVLLGGAELSVQRQDRDVAQVQVAAHGLDLAHARQEHEDRAVGGCDRLLDRARHVRQVLAANAHPVVPDRTDGLDAARRGSVA